MNQLEFYYGDRVVDRFEISLRKGKARLSCTVVESWEQDETLRGAIRCGKSKSFKLVRRTGTNARDWRKLETLLGRRVGLTSLADLKAEIKKQVSRELELEAAREAKETFQFTAPPSGNLKFHLYRLTRYYYFAYEGRRLLGKKSWSACLRESTPCVWDNSVAEPHDPRCRGRARGKNAPGELVDVVLENRIGTRQECVKRQDGMHLPALKVTIPERELASMLKSSYRVKRANLPPHLLFLAGAEGEKLTARFVSASIDKAARPRKKDLPGPLVTRPEDQRRGAPEGTPKNRRGNAYLYGLFAVGMGVVASLFMWWRPRERGAARRGDED